MRVRAPAKLNLTLEVTSLEPNGYHTLDSIFCWLDLHDELELEKASDSELHLTSELGPVDLGGPERNLVWRALHLLEEKAGRSLPTRIALTKRIPLGGGLGGGSANAAAVLWGVTRLYQLDSSSAELLELASTLGADVAFGLVGGLARGRRYGDLLEPLPFPPELREQRVLLVFPPFGCGTPEVYREWDREPSRMAEGSSARFLSAADRGARLQAVANDLQEPAFRFYPELREYHRAMREAGLEAVTLSGSGSTLFGFLPPEGAPTPWEEVLPRSARWVETTLSSEARGE